MEALQFKQEQSEFSVYKIMNGQNKGKLNTLILIQKSTPKMVNETIPNLANERETTTKEYWGKSDWHKQNQFICYTYMKGICAKMAKKQISPTYLKYCESRLSFFYKEINEYKQMNMYIVLKGISTVIKLSSSDKIKSMQIGITHGGQIFLTVHQNGDDDDDDGDVPNITHMNIIFYNHFSFGIQWLMLK